MLQLYLALKRISCNRSCKEPPFCNSLCYILGMVAMGYTERIHEARPKLSKSFKRLADYILDSYIQAALMTASELAQEVNVDAATVVRFAQALDYSGFPELQDEIKDRVLADLHLEPGAEAAAESAAGILERSFQSFTQSLERTRKLLDASAAEALAGHMQQARTLIAVTESSHEGVLRYFLNQVGDLGIAHQLQAQSRQERTVLLQP